MQTLLLTIDSLRKDHLGFYGHERDTTPFLDDMAEENLIFENPVAAAPFTMKAVPSILTGNIPENAAEEFRFGFRLDAETIAEVLPEQVHTSGITSGVYLTPVENLDRGFDEFQTDYWIDDSYPLRQTEYLFRIASNNQFRTGDEINDEVIGTLDEHEDCFVWAHYMDAHQPYNKFDEWHWGEEVSNRKIQRTFRKAKHFPSLMSEKDTQLLVDAYDNSIRQLDGILEDLFEEIPEDTDVYIVGDHGEIFGKNNEYEHPDRPYDELYNVPLMARNGEKGTVKEPVSTMSIVHSVAEEYDVKFSAGGDTLLP